MKTRLLSFCLILLSCLIVGTTNLLYGQGIEETLLTKGTDSMFLQESFIQFDDSGNYLFLHEINDTNYIITNRYEKIPISGYASGGMSSHYSYRYPKSQYYVSADLPYFYGPTQAEDLSYFRRPQSENELHELVSFYEKDSIRVFKDGRFFFAVDTFSNEPLLINGESVANLAVRKNQFGGNDWAAISNNGNILMKREKNGIDSLFLNDILIDTTIAYVGYLNVNDKKDVAYVKTYKRFDGEKDRYFKEFHFNKRKWDAEESYLSTNHLYNHGGYYYLSYPSDSKMQMVNNELYKETGQIQYVYVPDAKNHLLLLKSKETGQWTIESNGKTYHVNFEDISQPVIDGKGNVSFMGRKNYYWYKWMNGVEAPNPITRFNLRPEIVYLSPKGDVMTNYHKKDSTLIYWNDSLFFAGKSPEINAFNGTRFQSGRSDFVSGYDTQWLFIQKNEVGYVLWNGQRSQPIASVTGYSRFSSKQSEDHEIIKGAVNENGYYLIIQRPDKKVEIVINHRVFILQNVSKVYKTGFFDGKTLIFYGVRGLDLMQFKIEL